MEQLSFSKINLGLAILNKRPDGYHNIDTIFQSIMLGDSIYFAKHHSVVFSGSMPELPKSMGDLVAYDESNLAFKALRAVQVYTGCKTGGAIHLLKRIPPAAGLGGGSGDAAAMIKGLNRFWDLRLTKDEMMALARPLGADVAFLMEGGTARGTEKGDVLTLVAPGTVEWLLVVNPHVPVSTATAYSHFNGTTKADSAMIERVKDALEKKSMKDAFLASANTFEELLFPVHDELSLCKEFFIERGYPTIMSGSGPSMIVLLPTAKDALHLLEEIKKAGHNWLALITKTKMQEEIA